MRLIRAANLQPGDKLFWTLETVVRTFVDRMTRPGYIMVQLRGDKHAHDRVTEYKRHRAIKVL